MEKQSQIKYKQGKENQEKVDLANFEIQKIKVPDYSSIIPDMDLPTQHMF